MVKDDLHISSLIHQLRHIDVRKRKEALEELIELSEETAIHSYIALLKDKDKEIRALAAKAIGVVKGHEGIEGLVEALGDKDENVNYWITFSLSQLETEKVFQSISWALTDNKLSKYAFDIVSRIGIISVNRLIEILGDKNWKFRSKAAEALTLIGFDALPKLTETLHTTQNTDVRYWIIKILGEIGNPDSIVHIDKYVENSDPDIRKASVESLYLIGTDESIETLSNLINSEFEDIRFNAVRYLGEIGSVYFERILEKFEDESWIVRDAAGRAASNCGEIVIPLLEELLVKGNENQRFCSCKALSGFGEKGFKGLFIALDDTVWAIRKLSSDSLAKFGKIILPHLIRIISSKDASDEKIFWTIRTIGNIRDASIVERLIPFLNYPNKDIRFSTVRALGKIGDKSIVPKLINTLEKQDEEARYWSIKALGEIGPEAIKGLMDKLSDKDWNIRRIASQAIGEIGEMAVPYLIKGMKDNNLDTRYWSGKALIIIGFKAVEEVIKLLKNKEWSIRKNAANVLLEIGPVVISKLMEALKNGNEHFRYWIPKIISKMNSSLAVTELVHFLTSGTKDERVLALKSLSDLGIPENDTEISKLVIDCLQDEFWEVRQEAAKAIGLLNIEDGGTELISSLLDSDPVLRANAALSIGLINEQAGAELLIDLLDDPDRNTRISALRALGLLKSKIALKKVCQILKENESELNDTAIYTLGEIGNAKDVDLILTFFGNNIVTDICIVEALGKINCSKSVSKLSDIVFNQKYDRKIRAEALKSLIKLNPKNINDILNQLVEDKNWHVRKIAFKQLYRQKGDKKLSKIKKKLYKENKVAVELYNAGITSYKNGNINEALSNFKAVIEKKSDFKEAYVKIIQICIENNFIKNAKFYIKSLLSIDKMNENALLSYGYILFLEKKVEKAKSVLKKVYKHAEKENNKQFAKKLLERLK